MLWLKQLLFLAGIYHLLPIGTNILPTFNLICLVTRLLPCHSHIHNFEEKTLTIVRDRDPVVNTSHFFNFIFYETIEGSSIYMVLFYPFTGFVTR